MARERSRGEEQTTWRGSADARAELSVLSRAEARALKRSAPLTPAEFKALGRMAQQRVDPLPVVLDGAADPPVPPSRAGD